MNLRSRIERLEMTAGINDEPLPEFVITFVKPVQSEDGRSHLGGIAGGLRILPGGGQQWLDADMNPV